MQKKYLQFLLIGIYVTFFTFIAWWTSGRSILGVDDANIYFSYMKNFSEGHGFIYSVGSGRVEGFTSLLWTLLGSLIFYFSNNPELILLIVNIVIITFALWKIIQFLDKLQFGTNLINPYSLLLLGLLGVIPGYFEWTVLSLLETGLWSSLLILISINLLSSTTGSEGRKDESLFILYIILLILCRPESILWGAFFIFAKFMIEYTKEFKLRSSLVKILPPFAAYTITLTGLIIWRLNYFGYPLPNTYYAKVSGDNFQNLIQGIIYNASSFLSNPYILLTIILSIFVFPEIIKTKKFAQNKLFIVLNSILIVTYLIPLSTGGDHFGYFRFIQPTLPLILIILVLALEKLNFELKYSYIIAFILFASFTSKETIYSNLKHRSNIALEWDVTIRSREYSRKMNEFFSKMTDYPSQGVLPAGATSYIYRGQTIDLLGLNNVEMAHAIKIKDKNIRKNHASFSKEVFFRQKPDIFWYGSNFVDIKDSIESAKLVITPFERLIFRNIEKDKNFDKQYSCVLLINIPNGTGFKTFASKSFLRLLDTNFYSVKVIPYE